MDRVSATYGAHRIAPALFMTTSTTAGNQWSTSLSVRRTPRSAAMGEQREPAARCSAKFDAADLRDFAIIAYCMIRSARWSTAWGIVSLSAFAVRRLMTSSKVVGCSMGKSDGFAPLRILSTLVAARRGRSKIFTL